MNAPSAPFPAPATKFTPRQSSVLAAALALLVEKGEKALTTSGIARAANCSKESLYKWFGDRDGVLAAVIAFQASKVRAGDQADSAVSLADYRAEIERFAFDLLTVLAGETSIALNRLAISQTSRDDTRLGTLLIERGRQPIRARATALLERGRLAGYLAYDDEDAATRTFYGLVVGDMHVSLLLGAAAQELDIKILARRASDQLFTLFGRPPRATAGNEPHPSDPLTV